MNVLSLFDGISCGRVALDRAGIKVDKYYASEIENSAITITMNNYPDTIQVGDVTKINGKDFDVDLLIGGSPCQGFSSAGKGLNFADPRSVLFFEYVRILKEAKPKYFLLENVNMKQEFQDIISSQLGVEPIDINSSLVSAGLRRRSYWTNIPNVSIPEDKGIMLNDILDNAYSEKDKSYCIDAMYGKGSNLRRYLHRGSRQIVFTDKEFMNSVTRNKPHIDETNKIGNDNRSKWRFLTPEECEKIQTLPIGYTDYVSKYNRYHGIGNGWTVDVISHIFKGIKGDI
jgi:site-specific DNA-cytosine methylase